VGIEHATTELGRLDLKLYSRKTISHNHARDYISSDNAKMAMRGANFGVVISQTTTIQIKIKVKSYLSLSELAIHKFSP
jgi:hypothetical protein